MKKDKLRKALGQAQFLTGVDCPRLLSSAKVLMLACALDPQLGEPFLRRAMSVFNDMEAAIREQDEEENG